VSAPITSPARLRSGPPELPGFGAASVWITPSISRPVRARSEGGYATTGAAARRIRSPCSHQISAASSSPGM
jgi:hypothetical protein